MQASHTVYQPKAYLSIPLHVSLHPDYVHCACIMQKFANPFWK